MIKTKIHSLQEHIRRKIDDDDKESIRNLQDLCDMPLYVVEDSAVMLLEKIDTRKCINALVEAEAVRLPVPEMIVELRHPKHPKRSIFCFMNEIGSKMARVIDDADNSERDLNCFKFGIQTAFIDEGDPDKVVTDLSEPASIYVTSVADDDTRNTNLAMGQNNWMNSQKRIAPMALTVALLILNASGIEREKVKCDRLNRARSASKKTRIPDHTIIRLGHVYDREGVAHRVGKSGWKMPVHVRSAHTRQQFHGPGRSLRKPIFVPMKIINYDPASGEEPPKPKPKLVKA